MHGTAKVVRFDCRMMKEGTLYFAALCFAFFPQVSSIFRSVRYVTRYQKYPGLVKWFESLFYAAKDEGIRHIYVSMHERNMKKVRRSCVQWSCVSST